MKEWTREKGGNGGAVRIKRVKGRLRRQMKEMKGPKRGDKRSRASVLLHEHGRGSTNYLGERGRREK